jgi:hypothetical protein
MVVGKKKEKEREGKKMAYSGKEKDAVWLKQ